MRTRQRSLGVLLFLFAAVLAHATINPALQSQLGNPSNATADTTNHNHYLIQRAQYALDFSDANGDPNWVSWDLTSTDVGSSGRSNFIPDPDLPAGFYPVVTTDYTGSGYDRGHMCPSADRTVSSADNQIVFYMSNIIPQTADNNQGPWASFETYCRTLASSGNELLIICGPSGFAGSRIPSGKAAIPGYTWKVVAVVPAGAGTALSRIDASTRIIAIKMPNIAGIRSNPWENYITSAAQLESDTGFNLFRGLEARDGNATLANNLRAKVDGQTVTGAPTIAAQPAGQSAPVGGSATFTVTANGDAPLSYQWLKDDGAIAGATNATLTLTNVQAADVATYTVTITNNVGSITSNGAALVVTGLLPTIVDQPASQTAAAGTTITFAVTAGGSPPFTYHWRKAGSNLSDGGNVSGSTTPTLTLTNVQAADIASYDVVVSNPTNGGSSITSNTASLSVTPAAPTILSQPANRSLAPGSTAAFTVVATGTAPLSYQWRKGGVNINTVANPSAATASLSLPGITLADAGNYDVVVSNGVLPNATSNLASLSISNASADQIFYTGGTYLQDFDTLPASGTFTLTGAATAIVPLANAPINASNAGGWSFSKYAGTGTVPNFQVNAGSSTTGGVFSYGTGTSTDRALGSLASGGAISRFGATFVNNTGQTIDQFTLSFTEEQWRHGGATTANTLTFSYGVGATDINTGTFTNVTTLNVVGLSVSATGSALDGNNAANRVAKTATVTSVGWGPGQTLIIRWTDVDDAGSDDGLAIDDLSLTTPISGPVGPTVASTSPAASATNVALNAPIAITFNQAVAASGSWFTINSATRGAIAATVSVSADAKTYTLTPPANFDYSESISVKVLAAGITSASTGLHLTSDYAFAFVTSAPIAPAITTQPVAQTASAGTDVSFTVAASGSAPFSYQWRKGGIAISGNASASSATLVLTNVQAADIASYDVIVSNGVNPAATSNSVALTVNPAAPTILTHPISQTVTAGDNITLTVTATGTNPLSYKWRRNGSDLSDGGVISGSNTATLTLTGAQPANSGSYTVVVSNGVLPNATSNAANILVNPLPQPFTPGNIVVVRVGTGTGSLVNTGNPIYLDEFSPAGALVQSIALPFAASGANKPIVLGGTSTTEGGLSRSADRRYLTLAGYATTTGGASSLSGTTAAAVNRVIARIDSSAVINTSTALTDWASTNSPRGATSADGTAFWVSGGAGGVRRATLGATTSGSISTTVDNLRAIDTAANQLYVSTQSGSAVRIGSVGTGLPVASGQVVTNLPGLPTTISPNGFFFADLDASVAGVDTLYVADESASGGILKYSLVGGVWTANGTITAASARGITGIVSGNTVTLFATTGGSSATGGGTLYKFTDTTGYNGAVSGSATGVATAGANTAFRGIALAPGFVPAISPQPVSQTATVGDQVTFTVGATGSTPLTYQWRKGGVNLSNATNATLTLPGITMANAGSYDVVVTNPIGSTTSDAATLTVNPAPATVALSNLSQTYTGSGLSATVTTTPPGLSVSVTYNGSTTLPINAGSYSVVATITDPNYVGSTTGTLVIDPAAATVALSNLSQIYTGSGLSATVTTTPPGLAVSVTYNGSATLPINAGSYTVVATITDPNYVGSKTDTLIIGQASATIALGSLSATYNGTPKPVTYTTTPAGLGAAITYNGSTTAPTNAGSYNVVATITDPNYSGGTTGTLSIAKAPASVLLGSLSATYDGSAKPVTVTTTPVGLSVGVTYNGSTTAPKNAGSYTVVATVNETNYTGSATGTLVIAPASATVALSNLTQAYDGLPKPVTVTTTPAGLNFTLTYDGSSTPPTNPGAYAVVATIVEQNYIGSANGTLVVGITALVTHAPEIAGALDGSLQVLTGENLALSGNAWISGDVLVPGTPNVVVGSKATLAGTLDGTGGAAPSNYQITLSGNALARYIVRRTNAISLPVVGAPPPPAGTRDVILTAANQNAGDFATLRNLTLEGSAGRVVVPAGTYGNFAASGSATLVLGTADATAPAVYNLQALAVAGNAQIEIAGPVILNLASGLTLSRSVGAAAHPEWLLLNIDSGGLSLDGSATLHGTVRAPRGTVAISGTLHGSVAADRLIINGNGAVSAGASTVGDHTKTK